MLPLTPNTTKLMKQTKKVATTSTTIVMGKSTRTCNVHATKEQKAANPRPKEDISAREFVDLAPKSVAPENGKPAKDNSFLNRKLVTAKTTIVTDKSTKFVSVNLANKEIVTMAPPTPTEKGSVKKVAKPAKPTDNGDHAAEKSHHKRKHATVKMTIVTDKSTKV